MSMDDRARDRERDRRWAAESRAPAAAPDAAQVRTDGAPLDEPAIAALPKVGMLFTAAAWTFNLRLGRSGREEGEGVIIMGEVSYRGSRTSRVVSPARAMIVKTDSRKRLELKLAPQDAVLTIPLEPFAMQRLQERLKDLISFYGMTLRVSFMAADTSEPQALEAVDFAFSAESKAQAKDRTRRD